MTRRGRGWHGERKRHRLAALKGKQDVKDSKLLLRTLTKRLEGKSEKPTAYMEGFREGIYDSVGEKGIADLTENLEVRIWDRMGEYGFSPKDFRDIKEFESRFDEWSGWEDAYDEIGGEVAHEFDLEPGTRRGDLAIEVLTDIIHKRIYSSIMNMMDEMIKSGGA